MNDKDLLRSDRATRVQTFLLERAEDFAPASKGAALRTELDSILASLATARVGQLRTPVAKETLLDALFTDFKDISRTARAIAIDEPGFRAGDFRFPDDYTEAAATTHANALLQLLADQETDSPEAKTAKAALRAKFIAFEIREDFVGDLQADLAALTERNTSKHSDNQEGVLSTAAIGVLLAQAQSVITRLDTIVRNKYSNHPDTLAAWKSATHVPRAARKRDEGDNTAPPAPPVA